MAQNYKSMEETNIDKNAWEITKLTCEDLNLDEIREIDKKARNVLIASTLLCLTFIIGEIIGGVLSGSLAIITDSSHLLTDLITYIISIIGLYTSQRAPTTRFTFGWYRVEIMGALTSVVMIWLVTGVLIYLATSRLINPDYSINAGAMLVTAGCGLLFNVILLAVLFAYKPRVHSKDDGQALLGSHGHSHDNVNVKSALIHVFADLVQSVGVLIAAVLIYINPEWKMADPITTYIFGVIVLITTIGFLRSIVNILMEASPSNINHGDVVKFIGENSNVVNVHDVHIWSLTTNRAVISAHVVIDDSVQSTEMLRNLNTSLKKKFSVSETMIQIEQIVSSDEIPSCICKQ